MTRSRQIDIKVPLIAVVIPCYKVTKHIAGVIDAIGPEVSRVYVVDDKCPDESGAFVEANIKDKRVHVLYHDVNKGVGGATLTGMQQAVADGCDILVKIDGDGQMDPALIPSFVGPIIEGQADCTKGNRFFEIDGVKAMPTVRLIGNAGLSFMAKLSTGYWHIFDPNNGFLAVHAKVLEMLPCDKIAQRYFFETDFLFRLNTVQAVVVEVPMQAVYGDEESNLHAGREITKFAYGHLRNFLKRIFYSYYLRNFSVASIEIIIALVGLFFGVTYGVMAWCKSAETGIPATAGTIMLAALPVIIGMQSLFAFFNHDLNNVPKEPLHKRMRDWASYISGISNRE
ncbi:MAG: glycosyltransferase family 2 protein [Methylocystaceae bacterium]|nr:glycosyltransferase family 2 protein [Methylocystaceae bacterium]